MLVTQILNPRRRRGGDRDARIDCGRTLRKDLAEKRIGTVVVICDGHPLTVFVRARHRARSGRTGRSCLSDKVETYMTTKLVTCTRKTRRIGASRDDEGRFRHMPVVEDGQLDRPDHAGDVVKAPEGAGDGKGCAARDDHGALACLSNYALNYLLHLVRKLFLRATLCMKETS